MSGPKSLYNSLVSYETQTGPLEGFFDKLEDWLVYPADNLYWFAKDSLKPHNRLKIESLDKSYCDPREKLLHASFQVLKDFVEQEKPFEHIDWDWSPEHKHAGDEIRALYHWWTVTRPGRPEPYAGEFIGRRYVEDEAEENHLKGGLGTVDEPGEPSARTGTVTPEFDEYLKMQGFLEDKQEEFDQTMLVRLAKVRLALWT